MYKNTRMWNRLQTSTAKKEYVIWVTSKMDKYPKHLSNSAVIVTNYLNSEMTVYVSQKLMNLDAYSVRRTAKQLRAAEAVKKTIQWYRNILTGTK